jgi:hypothetical protein
MPTTLGWNEIALRLALTVVAGSLICASRQHCVRCHDRGDARVCNCNWSLFWRRPNHSGPRLSRVRSDSSLGTEAGGAAFLAGQKS